MSKIVLRRRFPNYICDGRPLGDDEAAYLSEVNSMEEFYDLDWVKEYDWVKEWRVSYAEDTYGPYKTKGYLMGIDSDGRHWALAYLLEGELDLPEWKDA